MAHQQATELMLSGGSEDVFSQKQLKVISSVMVTFSKTVCQQIPSAKQFASKMFFSHKRFISVFFGKTVGPHVFSTKRFSKRRFHRRVASQTRCSQKGLVLMRFWTEPSHPNPPPHCFFRPPHILHHPSIFPAVHPKM